MSFLSKLFGRKTADNDTKVGGMEDFMTLIRVYLQADIAAQVGISNLAALPDLRVFKQTLKVPTQNNKLGIAEKKRCAKILNEVYGISTTFTQEIDASVRMRSSVYLKARILLGVTSPLMRLKRACARSSVIPEQEMAMENAPSMA